MELRKESEERYTYAEYATWDDAERWELIDGLPCLMSPALGQRHQEIAMELGRQIANYLKGKTCKVFPAPFDVRLNAAEADDTVVQPDLTIICDPAKLTGGKNCVGAPDMVVEILSPATSNRDKILKFHAYREAGVPEYWLLDPFDKTLTFYLLKDGFYVAHTYGEADTVSVSVLKDCVVLMEELFPKIRSQRNECTQ